MQTVAAAVDLPGVPSAADTEALARPRTAFSPTSPLHHNTSVSIQAQSMAMQMQSQTMAAAPVAVAIRAALPIVDPFSDFSFPPTVRSGGETASSPDPTARTSNSNGVLPQGFSALSLQSSLPTYPYAPPPPQSQASQPHSQSQTPAHTHAQHGFGFAHSHTHGNGNGNGKASGPFHYLSNSNPLSMLSRSEVREDSEEIAIVEEPPDVREVSDENKRSNSANAANANGAKEAQAAGVEERQTLTEIVQHFNRQMRLFRFLLLMSGMHQKTSKSFRWFVRVVLWSCTMLCTMNIGFRTTSYRNPLFDITLSMLHFWVAIAYEKWVRYLSSRHWKDLMAIVNRVQQRKFSARINIVGLLAMTIIPLCAAVITLGWLVPIISDVDMGVSHWGHQDWGFMLIHGALMIIIIPPWASACLASCFLFYLMVSAHKADFDRLYTEVHKFIRTASAAEQYFFILRKQRPVLNRLLTTSAYFQNLFTAFIVVSFMLVLSGTVNLNILVTTQEHPNYHDMSQDLFYIGLGILGLICGLSSTSSLSEYWNAFLNTFSNIPSQYPITNLPYFSSLVAFLTQFSCHYQVYGLAVTRRSALIFLAFLAELYVVVLLLFNYFGPNSKCG